MKNTSKTTIVTFMRHGGSESYTEHQLSIPGPHLTEKGRVNALKTGRFLKNFKFDKIICSTMTRAIESSEIVNKYIKLDKVEAIEYHKRLSEFHNIIFDAKTAKEKNSQAYKLHCKKARRAINLFKQILKENQNKKLLFITHGNIIRACLGTSLGFPLLKCPDLNLFTCSLSSLLYEEDKVTGLYHINSVDHYQTPNFEHKFNQNKLF